MDMNKLIREIKASRVNAEVNAKAQIDAIDELTDSIKMMTRTLVKQLSNSKPSSIGRLQDAEREKENKKKKDKDLGIGGAKKGSLLDIAQFLTLGSTAVGAVVVGLAAIMEAAFDKSNVVRQKVADGVRIIANTGAVVVQMITDVMALGVKILKLGWGATKLLLQTFSLIPRILGKIPLLGAPFRALAKFIDSLTIGLFESVGRVIKNVLGPFVRIVAGPFRFFSKIFPWLSALIVAFDTGFAMWKEYKNGGNLIEILAAGVKGFFGSLWRSVTDIIKGLDWIVEKVLGFIGLDGLYRDLRDMAVKFVKDYLEPFTGTFMAIWNGIGDFLNSVVELLSKGWESIKENGFMETLGKTIEWLGSALWGAIESLGSMIWKFIIDLKDGILGWIKEQWDAALQFARDQIDGAVQGVKDFFGGVIDRVAKFFEDIGKFFENKIEELKVQAYNAIPGLKPTVEAVKTVKNNIGALDGLMLGSEVDKATDAVKKKNGFTSIMGSSTNTTVNTSNSSSNTTVAMPMDTKNARDPRVSFRF